MNNIFHDLQLKFPAISSKSWGRDEGHAALCLISRPTSSWFSKSSEERFDDSTGSLASGY